MLRLSVTRQEEAVLRLTANPARDGLLALSYPSRRVSLWTWDQRFDLRRQWEWGGRGSAVGDIFGAAFHPSGDLFALSYANGPVELRRFPDGSLTRRLWNAPGYGAVSIPPSGDYVTAACSFPYGNHQINRAEVYALATGQLVGWFAQSDTDYAWHPGGEVLATASTGQGGVSINFA